MPVKMTGQQWKQFVVETKKMFEDAEIINAEIWLNGKRSERPLINHLSIDDNDAVDVLRGDIAVFVEPPRSIGGEGKYVPVQALIEHVHMWIDKQMNTTMIVKCPRGKEADLRTAIELAGGEVAKEC